MMIPNNIMIKDDNQCVILFTLNISLEFDSAVSGEIDIFLFNYLKT